MKWPVVPIDSIKADQPKSIVGGPFGSSLTTRHYVEDGVPVIRGGNLPADMMFLDDDFVFVSEEKADQLAGNTAVSGDVVFTQRGTLGQVGLIPENSRYERYVVSQSQMKLTVDPDKADPRFIYYYFRHPDAVQMVKNHAITSGVPHINLGILKGLEVPLPPLSVQVDIVAMLKGYDDLIETNRRRMVLLEESARLLYREWFVHLRFPGHESARFVNGLPEGWARLHIEGFLKSGAVDLQTGPFGTQLKASHYTEEGTPVINVRNIGYGDLRPDKLEFVPEEIVDRLSVHVLRPDDIVFGRKGAVDRHLLITTAYDGWMQGSDCIRLRSHSEEICPVILSFAFREPSHHDWMLGQCGNKATMASLNQSVIARIPVLVASVKIRAMFQSFARDSLNQIAVLAAQNQKLKTARDLLLPRLMSGEIEV